MRDNVYKGIQEVAVTGAHRIVAAEPADAAAAATVANWAYRGKHAEDTKAWTGERHLLSGIRTTAESVGALIARSVENGDADEVVLVFVEWSEAPHPTPDRSLAAFARVHVKAGASQAVELELAPARLAVLAVPGLGNASSTWLATAATVKVYVGGQQPGMAVKAPSNVLSAEIEVEGKEVALSAC